MEKIAREEGEGDSLFFNRDISWLSFNERILEEAADDEVPLLERLKFLAIYSSNLDEFYRVRMPVLQALQKISKDGSPGLSNSAARIIAKQQDKFGRILTGSVVPGLKDKRIHFLYNESFPDFLNKPAVEYFLTRVLAFLHPVELKKDMTDFFPENNKLYLLVLIEKEGTEKQYILNIPSDHLPRFYSIKGEDGVLIAFLDDIVRRNLHWLFKNSIVRGCFSFKITRDAELDIADEYEGDQLELISRLIQKRDKGLATRFLYQPGIPEALLELIRKAFNLKEIAMMAGGVYHNLKDLMGFPASDPLLSDEKWPAINYNPFGYERTVFDFIADRDVVFHPPYHSYTGILRFFNEASTNRQVKEIYITLYRIASDSLLASALINAARNGKKVKVVLELKARFDEANNIKWGKKMKEAGVELIYSPASLKVHAKIALVKREVNGRTQYSGLLATGNFNENTAAIYTDHVLMTSHPGILREIELLFIFLSRKEAPPATALINFHYLLVAQFNLRNRFTELIDREIAFARAGKDASIIIKMNNLEEKSLIGKLYEASQAGVMVQLIIRSICRLIPGVGGMSENITVRRIVGRYLEHGRVFIFNNGGETEVYMGSADWMNRNIYRRIEVCFPVLDSKIKQEMIEIVRLQLQDNVKAVEISEGLENVRVKRSVPEIRSQQAIYTLLNHE